MQASVAPRLIGAALWGQSCRNPGPARAAPRYLAGAAGDGEVSDVTGCEGRDQWFRNSRYRRPGLVSCLWTQATKKNGAATARRIYAAGPLGAKREIPGILRAAGRPEWKSQPRDLLNVMGVSDDPTAI